MTILDDHDGVGLAELVRTGQVHPRELVAEAIDRAETRNPALNAIIHERFEGARADADGPVTPGPFAGVPFLMKDYKGREAGQPYHMGVRTLRDLDYRPRSDAPLTLAFRATGLISIGRTNVPQMALMGTTEPELYGPTHNPWDLGRSPGGSSGGSAAAVAAGIVPLAHANDISGSIRIPASLCGVVGLKATRGRVTPSTVHEPVIGMNCEGVVSRSVRDTAVALDAIAHRSGWWPAPALPRPLADEVGADPGRLRVAVWTTAFNGSPVDPDSAAAATDTARLLESMGHHVVVDAPAILSDPVLWEAAKAAMATTAAAEAAAWTDRIGHPLGESDLEARSWGMVQAGNAMSAVVLTNTIETLQCCAAEAAAWFEGFDLLVTPTTAAPATMLGDYLNNYVSGLGSAFTRPINVTGNPAISLPVGWPADGLPRGVQLIAGYGREDVLIRVASAIEAAVPWWQRRPPTLGA